MRRQARIASWAIAALCTFACAASAPPRVAGPLAGRPALPPNDPLAACLADPELPARLGTLERALAAASAGGGGNDLLAAVLAEAGLPAPPAGYLQARKLVRITTAGDAALGVTRGNARLELLPALDFLVVPPAGKEAADSTADGDAVLATTGGDMPLTGRVALEPAPAEACAVAGDATCRTLVARMAEDAARRGARALLLVDAPPPPRLAGPGDVHPSPAPPPALSPRVAAGWLMEPGTPALPLPVALLSSRAGNELLGLQPTVADLFSGAASMRAERELAIRVDLSARTQTSEVPVMDAVALLPGSLPGTADVAIAAPLDQPRAAAAAIEAARALAVCRLAHGHPIRLLLRAPPAAALPRGLAGAVQASEAASPVAESARVARAALRLATRRD